MWPDPSAHSPAIVLIEDDPNLSLMLARHLERQGWTVHAASSLAGAREVFRTVEWDLAILDRRLPDGDGIDLCTELRAKAAHGYILIVSGESSGEAKLQGFQCGADDYVTKPFQLDELMARIRAGLRIVELQKALIKSNRQLEDLSLTDGLTNLRNRRAFDEEITMRFEEVRRYHRPLSVAVIDVNHFKSVNDAHGHDAGDGVLRKLAEVIEHETRATDFVARYGGEEFAVILPETQLADAILFADKLRGAIVSASLHNTTVSIGVAGVPHSEMASAAELVRAADQALYRAKKNGRNRVEAERRKAGRAANENQSRAEARVHTEATRLRSDRPWLQQ